MYSTGYTISKMTKSKQLNIRVNEEDKKLLKKDSKGEQRTAGNLLLWCWKKWRKSKRGK